MQWRKGFKNYFKSDMFSEHYKILRKEFENYIKKWKEIFVLTGRINIVKMTILSTKIYRFNAISTKYTWHFFTELEKIILKFIWNHKRPQMFKAIFKKKQSWSIMLSDFRLCYKAIVIKIAWYWHAQKKDM